MAEKTPSFTGLVFGYALAHTYRVFKSKILDALYLLFSCVVGVPLFIWLWGVPEAMKEALGLVGFAFAPLGVFTAVVFLWQLWLAPVALAYEAAKVSWSAASAPSVGPLSLADSKSKEMAGEIQLLGEIVGRPKFTGFGHHTTHEMYFADLVNSTHPIWTRQDARQLRRDLINRIEIVASANTSNDSKEARAAVAEMDTMISSLVKILLGEA